MGKMFVKKVAGTVLLSVVGVCACAEPWDPPLGPDPAPEYEVTVDGRKVDLLAVQMFFRGSSAPVRNWGGVYWAASFPYRPGQEVRVRSLTVPLDKAEFRPQGRIGSVKGEGDAALSFTAGKPFRVVLERENRVKPLLLFGNAVETDLPDFSDPKVRRLGPGVHDLGKVTLNSNETLYLDYGAILNGGVVVGGTNVTIRGHGVISGAAFPRFKGPAPNLICGWHAKDLTIRDVILTAPWGWTLVLRQCDNVKVDGIRILGSRMLNDDAIDIVNSRNVLIRNSFIRAQDDLIAPKGSDKDKATATERILVENCDFWCDGANVFRIGFESHASGMGRIAGRNLEVLHVSPRHIPFEQYWAHAVFWLQPSGGLPQGDVLFENVNVNLDGYDAYLAIVNPRLTSLGNTPYTTGGSVSNVVFRNIKVAGKVESTCQVVVEGRSEKEFVKNVRFEKVSIFNRPLTAESPEARVGKFAEDVTFAK